MALFPQSCLELGPGEASLIMQQKQMVPKLEQQLYLVVDPHLSPASPHICSNIQWVLYLRVCLLRAMFCAVCEAYCYISAPHVCAGCGGHDQATAAKAPA